MDRYYVIACNNCFAKSKYCWEKDEALKMWNSRKDVVLRNKERLSPCPFCGSRDSLTLDYGWKEMLSPNSRWHVWCKKCGAKGTRNYKPQSAIDDWNKRRSKLCK